MGKKRQMESVNKTLFSVSVAMAAYNGEPFIESQMASILSQLREGDELVISLDPSSDDTEKIIRTFAKRDKRVKWVRGKGEGLVNNFGNAIRHCSNDIIFLSDQDDLWKKDKLDIVLSYFQNPQIYVVMHDAEIVDEKGEQRFPSFIKKRGCRTGIFKNIFKNSYIGCCMAFRKSIKKYILPFPENIPMHDQWIGLIGEITGKTVIIDDVLLCYRRHEKNASAETHSGIRQMLRWRLELLGNIFRFTVKYYLYKGRSQK